MRPKQKTQLATLLFSAKNFSGYAFAHYKPYKADLNHSDALTQIDWALKYLQEAKEMITGEVSKKKVCPDCSDFGVIDDPKTGMRSTCPCHL